MIRHPGTRRASGGVGDRDRSHHGVRLHPAGDVDHVTGGDSLPAVDRPRIHHRVAGGDADACP